MNRLPAPRPAWAFHAGVLALWLALGAPARAQAGDGDATELAFRTMKSHLDEWQASDALPEDAGATFELAVEALIKACGDELPEVYGATAYQAAGILREAGQTAVATRLYVRLADAASDSSPYRPYYCLAASNNLRDRVAQTECERILALGLESAPPTSDVALALQGSRGMLYAAQGLFDRADPLVRANLDHQRRLGQDTVLLQAAVIDACSYYIGIGKFDRAIAETQALADDLRVFPEATRSWATITVRLAIARLMVGLNGGPAYELAAARRMFGEATDVEEATELDRLQAELWLAYLAGLDGDVAQEGELIAAARRRLVRNAPDRATNRAERRLLVALESRALRRRGAPAAELLRARAELVAQFDALLAEQAAMPARPGGYGLLNDEQVRLVVAELTQLTALLEGEERGGEEGLERLLALRATGALVRDVGWVPTSLEEVRANLFDRQTGAIVFLPLFEETHVFAVDGERIVHALTTPAVELRAHLKSFADKVRTRPPRDADAARARLAELRKEGQPILDELLPASICARVDGWTTLQIGGDDLFEGALVLEALPYGDGYVGTEKAVGRLRSLALGEALFARRARAAHADPVREMILVADPVLGEAVLADDSGLAPLDLSDAEIAAWVAPFDPARVRVLRGDEAGLDALIAAQPARARMLHVMTHGVRRDAELAAGFVLAPDASGDGRVWWETVRERIAPSALVVLSACGTGRGPIREGDGGASDLSGAFFGAGAHTVVLASDDLSLAGTLALGGPLHAAVAEGVSTAEALRRARAELVRGGTYADPYYHALVHAVGLAQLSVFPPVEATGGRTALVIGTVLLALALALALALGLRARGRKARR